MLTISRRSSGASNRALLFSIVLSSTVLLTAQSAFPQSAVPGKGGTTEPPNEPPNLVATAVEGAPTVDGDILTDPAWKNVVPSTGFWQTTPDEGRPASEATEIRAVYTKTMLYFGIVCYDRDPSTIVVDDSRRDSALDDTDSLQIILDTYRDKQSGFVFGTSPSGLEYDGQVVNEGQGGSR